MYAHTRVQNLTETKTSLSEIVMTGFSPLPVIVSDI